MTARRIVELKPEFVEFVPDELERGTLYVSIQFKSIQHLCCCGCGRKVVTPLSPTGWQMTFDGRSISIHPSIGNWQKECGSHYFIVQNRVRWAPRWSDERIALGLQRDVQEKVDYYNPTSHPVGSSDPPPPKRRRKT